MHVKALESLLATGGGKLPVNVRVIIEGEEEVGGEGIAAFVREHSEELRADVALVSDTEMFAPDVPTLCVGLRGMIYTEIEARGARRIRTPVYMAERRQSDCGAGTDHCEVKGRIRTHDDSTFLRSGGCPQRWELATWKDCHSMKRSIAKRRWDRRCWPVSPAITFWNVPGAAHVGRAWHCGRVYRGGGQDGNSRARGGQVSTRRFQTIPLPGELCAVQNIC